ncbi:7107_t:CDS:2 [Entrophospora sp. SA101]|nr:7107_t:CDS:2 [Entrophospora sp. SA101]
MNNNLNETLPDPSRARKRNSRNDKIGQEEVTDNNIFTIDEENITTSSSRSSYSSDMINHHHQRHIA